MEEYKELIEKYLKSNQKKEPQIIEKIVDIYKKEDLDEINMIPYFDIIKEISDLRKKMVLLVHFSLNIVFLISKIEN